MVGNELPIAAVKDRKLVVGEGLSGAGEGCPRMAEVREGEWLQWWNWWLREGECRPKVAAMVGLKGNVAGCCVLPENGSIRGRRADAGCRNPRGFRLYGGRGGVFKSCLSSSESGRDMMDGRGCCGLWKCRE